MSGGRQDWIKPMWTVGMAGRVGKVLKLPVTSTRVGVCHILEENDSEGI